MCIAIIKLSLDTPLLRCGLHDAHARQQLARAGDLDLAGRHPLPRIPLEPVRHGLEQPAQRKARRRGLTLLLVDP